jgi:hypothetical protein
VTALLAGTVTVTATIDGVSGSAPLTISAPLSPPPASTTVELPRTYLNFSYPAKTGQTILVPPGGSLQTALNNAQRGDEIVLTAGATYSGNFVLPTKSGTSANGWIVIRSDKSGQLPSIGTRVTKSHASLMAKIVTPNTDGAIKTSGATSGWWLVGLEVTVSASLTAQQYGIVMLGQSGSPQTSLSSAPSDIVLDRMYIHGQTTTNLSRCVALNSARTQVSDSYIVECHGKDFDSQAIAGWNGPGPFKIVNNTLIGAGENVIFGGANPAIANLVPSDIEIRGNYLYTPIAWKGVWQKKNLLEFKNVARVLVEGNVMEGSWTDGQTGWAIIVRDDGCSWCYSRDVTIRRNLIRKAGAGINLANPLGKGTTRILVSENVLDSLATDGYSGDRRGFQLLGGVTGVTLERNLLSGGSLQAALIPEGGTPCVFRDNVWAAGVYGVIASGRGPGSASLRQGCGSTYGWSGMTLIGSSGGSSYPPGTAWATSDRGVARALRIRQLVNEATAGVTVPF